MFVLPWDYEDRYNFYYSRDCKWAFLSVVRKRQANTVGRVLSFYRRNKLEDHLAKECLEKAIACYEREYGPVLNLEKL